MATIQTATTSGVIRNSGTNYFAVLSAATGTFVQVYPTSGLVGQAQIGSTFYVNRGLMAFNTVGITSVPVSATFNFYMGAVNYSSYKVVKATAPNTSINLALADYNNYTATKYVTNNFVVNGTGWYSLPLNATALSDLDLLTTFQIGILSALEGTGPITEDFRDNLYFNGFPPYIEYTLASGFPHKVFSTPVANQNKINTTLFNTIKRIDGVPVAPTSYPDYFTDSFDTSYTTAGNACASPSSPANRTIRYISGSYTAGQYTVGSTVYTDSSLTTTFNGGNNWYGIGLGSAYISTYQISTSGVILNVDNCGY